jgi:hypothetical protein
MAATQRIQQGVRALVAFTHPIDYDLAGQYLNEAQMRLFKRMKRSEQLHSLNVLRHLGDVSDDVAVAALLHDCGKILHPLAIWQKSLAVITRKIARPRYIQWSKKSATHWWYRAFVVAENHPQWGADLVSQTGASAQTIWLIAHHADKSCPLHAYGNALRDLQRADDVN